MTNLPVCSEVPFSMRATADRKLSAVLHLAAAAAVFAGTASQVSAQGLSIPSTPTRIYSENLNCGGPAWFGERVDTNLGANAFTVRDSAPVATGVLTVVYLDEAARCRQAGPLLAITGPNALLNFPNSPIQPIPVSGATVQVPMPPFPVPALLNLPISVQWVRTIGSTCPTSVLKCSPNTTSFGPSFEVTMTGLPIAYTQTSPVGSTEKQVCGEEVTALPFVAFGQSSPRYTRLQAFPGASANGSFLLPNGAPVTFSEVNQPRHAPAVMSKIEALAALVQRRWGHLGYRLRVTSAKRDPGGSNSFHQYGRGLDLSLGSSTGTKILDAGVARHLDQLARLCVEVGFDWVWHETDSSKGPSNRHVHASMHTGGPSISGVAATGGALIAGSTTVREWTVTGTATDPDGVWQVLAVVRPGLGATADVNWATQPVIAAGYDSEVVGVVPPQSVPFSFTVRGSVNAGGDATVHLLARDTFGSVVYVGTDPYTRKPATVALPVRSNDLPNVPGMVRINPGTFSMGSNAPIGQPPYYNLAQSQPVHPVTITRPFLMGQYEVTQAQYQAVMGSNPSFFPGANRPVEQVSWDNAMAYCAALTASEVAQGRVPSGYQYRLPTEAEWEYCCRAGTTSEFSFGPSLTCGMANFYNEVAQVHCVGATSAVGSYPDNPWQLFDMHGNVWEWCLDSSDGSANYPSSAVSDPYVSSGPYRVVRGGSWDDSSYSCRSAGRSNDVPGFTDYYLGFRVCLAPVLVP